MGPVDYLVVEFPGSRLTGEAFPLLLDLVDRGLVRILDLVFVRKETDGSITGLAVADLDGDGEFDPVIFQGAASGLLGNDDMADLADVLEPGVARTAVVAGTASAVSNPFLSHSVMIGFPSPASA